jgi:hypothetical protein
LSSNERLAQANLGLHAQVRYLEGELKAPIWKRIMR